MIVTIDKKDYHVKETEFILKSKIEEYENLKILNDVPYFEILYGLITDLCNDLNINNFLHINPTHGGFLLCKLFHESYFINLNYINENKSDISNQDNINYNLKNHKVNASQFINSKTKIVLIESYEHLDNLDNLERIEDTEFNKNNIYISVDLDSLNNIFENKIKVSKLNLWLYYSNQHKDLFNENFWYYIKDNELDYDNLIHLCIMVKNGGDTFKQVLEENLEFIDKWTILDTGSTDSTIDIIKEVLVNKKKGQLFCEPFINFRDSRNKLLELAGNSCKYTLMLDDTYIIKGNLREFLTISRGDQFSSSYSLYLNSYDSEYSSNRLVKTNSGLKYIYRIHEVITSKNNNNVMIPKSNSYILDINSKFMEDRTNNRKYLDLQFLQEELDEDPNNTRTYYYFATTYSCLKQYDKAYEWFLKRINHENQGFLQEKVDACFEAARLANFKLNKSWEECQKLYEKTFELDNERPDSLYFIGIHYYLENDFITSHKYFKKAYEIGYPIHRQYSLKPTLSFHFCPKFLCTTSWYNKDYKFGQEISKFYLTNGTNKENEDMEYSSIVSWHLLYCKLNTLPPKVEIKKVNNINNLNKPLFCFVADGGFKKWSGSSIIKEGVGGSETYIIEMARYIQKSGQYNVIVFCNCEEFEIFEDVTYKHLDAYPEFITKNIIQHCIISRYTEYIPMTYESYVENVYLVLHDLAPVGAVIPKHDKLKKIFCLTEWHVENFTKYFGLLKDITVPFYYGVDTDKFKIDVSIKKIPFKFIYSSFPNRGLLELLKIWPKIYELEPKSTLHIYSNVDHKWSNDVEPEKMQKIKHLLNNYKLHSNNLGIYYHSWVSKKELAESWKTAEYWLYPCTFQETFCLTALEAAITKTFVISNNLAALKNTVGDRGLIIEGDPETEEWKEIALNKIKEIFTNRQFQNNKIQENYDWAKNLTWENQANKLLNNFINSNNLIFLNQYNWINDKRQFDIVENILTKIKLENSYSKILEISTDVGTSIIQFKKILKNSECYYINCNYENNKNIILNNFSVLNFKDEIILLNEKFNNLDEKDILLEINKQNFKTNFIHINCNYIEFNFCIILFLSWKILNKNGILLITKYFSDLYLNIINYFFNNLDITLISDKECIVILKN